MKKTMLMIVFILALGSQAIAKNYSELNLNIKANGFIKVVFDGQVIPTNDYLVSIHAVRPGKHSLQVFNVMRNYNSYNEEPLFIGEVYLPPRTVTNAKISHQRFIIEEQFAIINHNHNPPNEQYYSTKPIAVYSPAPPQATHCAVVTPAPVQEIIEVYPMTDEAFYQLKSAIASQWFSDGKLAVFNLAVSSNYFTSAQVKSLVNQFSFSGEKLEVAKRAYTQTLDPENYFMVYESLEWNSSMQNLSNYIASL